jgi:glucan phosphoethanolaminetransferase (alkaline phosphatase superfamily)
MNDSMKILFLIISTWVAYIIFLLITPKIIFPYISQEVVIIFFSVCTALVSIFGNILFEITLKNEGEKDETNK